LAGQQDVHNISDTNGWDILVTLTVLGSDPPAAVDLSLVELSVGEFQNDYCQDYVVSGTHSEYRVSTLVGGVYFVTLTSLATPLAFKLKVWKPHSDQCSGG
jgi:hypothetical protein